MNDQQEQMPPLAAQQARTRAGRVTRRDCGLCLLWMGIALLVITACPLGGWFLWQFVTGYTVHPLSADANTLYLADWSKDLDSWMGGAQWHWKEPGVISSVPATIPLYSQPPDLYFLSPYHPDANDIEIDAQIKSLDWGTTFVGDGPVFGIALEMDSQYRGYVCSEVPLFLGHVGLPAQGITRYSGIDEAHIDFSHYVDFKVTIQRQVAALFLDGQQIARATLSAYHAGGSVGVYSLYGTIEVEGFRVEKLP